MELTLRTRKLSILELLTMTSFDRLLAENVLVTVCAAGAGAGAQNLLWQTPGISAVFNAGVFPYSCEEIDRFLGFTPKKYVSEETALAMAAVAFMRSCETLELRMRDARQPEMLQKLGKQKPIGVALTATVASNYEHRGEHKVFVAAITEEHVFCESFPLPKGVGIQQRVFDGSECDKILINAIHAAAEIEQAYPYHRLRPQESLPMLKDLIFEHPVFCANGTRKKQLSEWAGLFPVTANPLHEGHEGIALTAELSTKRPTVFVLTAEGLQHKPASLPQVLRRIATIHASNRITGHNRDVLVTDKTLFVDIMRDNPRHFLILGADAFLRAIDPKWLGSEEETKKQFICMTPEMHIFTRNDSVADVQLAVERIWGIAAIGGIVKMHPFSNPLSSTEIRKQRGWA